MPAVLNCFPFFPLNVPALKPDLLRENSCVVYLSNFSIFEKMEGGKNKNQLKCDPEGSGHASQSPKNILGAEC